MRQGDIRQASARDLEECECQTEQEAWLPDYQKHFIQQAAQAAAEAQMQAMADQGQRDAYIGPAASERYADDDARERDPVCRKDTETLKRKRQEDQCHSFSRSISLLMTWAERLPEPMPHPPPRSALTYRQLSPVIPKREEEEYI